MLFERILVATDGSGHSHRAALTAAELARALGASLTVLTAYHQPPDFEGEPDYSAELEAATRRAEALLGGEAAAIQAAGGPPVETEALGGSQPGRTILDAAASGRYDLLVMGARGLRRLQSALLGSVSAHVMARRSIPALVVRGRE